MSVASTAVRGGLFGVVAAVLAFYVFQTRTPYPQWMLAVYHQPWLLPILFVGWMYVFTVDATLALMLLVVVVAVALDVARLGKPLVGL
jgi:hypothetical protein